MLHERHGQRNKRKQKEPAALYCLGEAGKFALAQPQEAQFARTEIHLQKNANVVKKRRDDAGHDDTGVGNTGKLGHDENGRPHDRRHDAAACRSGHFHARSQRRRIAQTLHDRNGDRTGRHHVGGGAAGDHAEKSRRANGDLGRPARLAAR